MLSALLCLGWVDLYVIIPDKIKIKISGDGSKVSRISNFVVLSFSVITDDLTLSSKDENVFCIVNCKVDYDHLKLACKPIFQKINTLYEKASIEVEGKHFGQIIGNYRKGQYDKV
jgi:hypothetical protein